MLCGLVEARLWGLTCVVRYVTPQIFQGEEITIASGILLSSPRSGTAMLTVMRSAVEALAPYLTLSLAAVRDTIVQNRAALLPGRGIDATDDV
jgi:hypothetical protein